MTRRDPFDAAPATGTLDEGGRRARRPRLVARTAKRAIDVVGATILLVLLAPVLAVVALIVLVVDGRPVLFRQRRVGRDEQPFTMVKFRTMVPDAEARAAALATRNERTGPLFKVTDDPRVTPLGRFLRESCLDELPQLVNVLAGHMSLVGPRPALPDEVRRFDRELRRRHEVRPGITGAWQVTGDDTNCFETYRRLDLTYVRGWTVVGDLLLLARTAASVAERSWDAIWGPGHLRLRRRRPNENVIVLPDAGREPAGPEAARRRESRAS